MKTLFVAINSQFVHLNLAVRSLAAMCKTPPEILEFNINTDITKIYADILVKKPNFVLFSCYIWNIEYVLRLTQDIKKANPDIKIAIGGPEVSFTPFEIAKQNPQIDYILCGECEEIIEDFIQTVEQNGDVLKFDGVVLNSLEGNDKYNIVENINELKPVSEIYKNPEPHKIYYYETARGCPFSCSYCLSGSIKDTTRYLDLDRVFIDLKYFSDNNIPLVKLVDRTFNANKKRAKEIIRFANENTGDTSFHFEIGADILDDELIELLNTSKKGKFQLEAGVQSCHEPTLNEVIRVTNLEKLYTNVTKIIDADNVHLHLDLIAGLPYEDFETFGKSINKLYDLNAHHLQLGFLKMLKGSVLLQNAQKYGIVYRSYPPYEVISTNDITYSNILALKNVEEIIERYYNADCGRKAMEILRKYFPTPFDMLCKMAEEFYDNGHLSRPMNITSRLEILCEFAKAYIKKDEWHDFLYSCLIDVLTYETKNTYEQIFAEIIENIDIKEVRKDLLASEKITGEQFKKAKFVPVCVNDKKRILMVFDKKITVFAEGF